MGELARRTPVGFWKTQNIFQTPGVPGRSIKLRDPLFRWECEQRVSDVTV